MELAGAEAEGAASVDQALLSFHLAGSLPLDLDFKQSLLSMTSDPSAFKLSSPASKLSFPAYAAPSRRERRPAATDTSINLQNLRHPCPFRRGV